MRQGQQNRRGRGRNRKAQNPLTRSFESNGPDVKLRGTPAHIAEKYMSLARDAASTGDYVLEQNYLQHAEHYNRIIMAFREQQMQQGGEMNGMGPRHRPQMGEGGEGGEDYLIDDEGDDAGQDSFGQPMMRMNEPQPNVGFEGPPRYDQGGHPQRFESQQRFDNRQRRPHHDHQHQRSRDQRYFDRNRDRDRDRDRDRERDVESRGSDRGPEPAQGFDRPRPQPEREAAAFPSERPAPVVSSPEGPVAASDQTAGSHVMAPPRPEGQLRRRERPPQAASAGHDQPEFLRRSVRRPRREPGPAASSDPGPDDTGSRGE